MHLSDDSQEREAAQQSLLAQALTAAANAILITDESGKIEWVNPAFTRLTGYLAEEAIGHTPALLKSGRQSAAFYAELWQTLLAGKVWKGELVDRRKDGSLYTVDEIITPLFNQAGAVTHFVAIQHDITQKQQESERERYLARHDVLTGLPNRASFLLRQQQEIQLAQRTQTLLATLFLDLDRFKPVNDTLGHHVGDQLLMAVAERLCAAVRQQDVVSRFGGDEFVILLTNFLDIEVVTALAGKLIGILAQPFVLQDQKIRISASIGIAIYPCDGEEAETLLMNADKAMYQAKCRGGNGYQRYHLDCTSVR